MAIPLRQTLKVGGYLMQQRLHKHDKYALVLQLEPLYQCNLACVGCGKIQHPDDILARRLTVEQCVAAVEECGAPMVSIAGGEPLVHKEIHKIVDALVERRRFVYLCTNALLLEKKLDLFTPSPYFSFSIHIDGLRERHDQSVNRRGTFDKAVAAAREARRRGFRVDHQHHLLRHGQRPVDPRCPRLPQRRPSGRRHADLPGLRLREGSRPGALAAGGEDPHLVPRGVRRRPAQALAAQPLAALPRFPGGQGRLPVRPPGGSRAIRSSGGSVPAT